MFTNGFFAGGMGIMPILMPITMIVIMLIMAFVARPMMSGHGGFQPRQQHSSRDHGESGGDEAALEILKRRYAGGEITKAEYEEMKRDI